MRPTSDEAHPSPMFPDVFATSETQPFPECGTSVSPGTSPLSVSYLPLRGLNGQQGFLMQAGLSAMEGEHVTEGNIGLREFGRQRYRLHH